MYYHMEMVDNLFLKKMTLREYNFFTLGTLSLGGSFLFSYLWSKNIYPFPPCLFHTITGQPCPFCGGTRSFVAMSRGEIGKAFYVYPLGPLLFLVALGTVLYLLFVLVTGKRIKLAWTSRQVQTFMFICLCALLTNWLLKLFILGY